MDKKKQLAQATKDLAQAIAEHEAGQRIVIDIATVRIVLDELAKRPLVLVEVEGGIADETVFGQADVLTVDWDNVCDGADDLDELLDAVRSEERLPKRVRNRIANGIERYR